MRDPGGSSRHSPGKKIEQGSDADDGPGNFFEVAGSPDFLSRLAHGDEHKVGARLSNLLDDLLALLVTEISMGGAGDLDPWIAARGSCGRGFGDAFSSADEIDPKRLIRRGEEVRDKSVPFRLSAKDAPNKARLARSSPTPSLRTVAT